MASKKLRDNEKNRNDIVFFTQFNSSTIYGLAHKPGESQVTLLLAIEYPSKYSHAKNYFTSSIMLKVNEKLSVDVPEFINN